MPPNGGLISRPRTKDFHLAKSATNASRKTTRTFTSRRKGSIIVSNNGVFACMCLFGATGWVHLAKTGSFHNVHQSNQFSTAWVKTLVHAVARWTKPKNIEPYLSLRLYTLRPACKQLGNKSGKAMQTRSNLLNLALVCKCGRQTRTCLGTRESAVRFTT